MFLKMEVGTNPEELVVVAHGGCFGKCTIISFIGEEGHEIERFKTVKSI
jgi:organic hydroperoxide reductase OsmC/OhrA